MLKIIELKFNFSFLLIASLLFYSILSSSFAINLLLDCGAHKIEICREHQNSHLLLKHDNHSDQVILLASESDNHDSSSHDASHQIEEKSAWNIVPTSANLLQVTSSTITVNHFFSDRTLSASRQLTRPAVPPNANTNFLHSRSVRILV